MKMLSEQHKPMTTRNLYDAITRYVIDNRRSDDLHSRWLCPALEPLLERISAAMNRSVDEPYKQSLVDFRSAEIEAEIITKRKETERLENELRKVREV